MTYADFAYYQDSYHGNQIRDATAFPYPAARASEYMDMITFDRLTEKILEEFETKIKNCCCALADAIYQYQVCAIATGESAPKKSESIGKYSVSFATTSETISGLLGGDTAGLQDFMKSICMRYLGHTGLMYRGCDYVYQ